MGILEIIRERVAQHEDEAVAVAVQECIKVAALAMLEAGVEKDKIKDLLQKHWDLRSSEADFFICEAEKSQN